MTPFRTLATSTVRFRAASLTPSLRHLTTTPARFASAGYGDPQDEKIKNETPTPQANPDHQTIPSSSPDPQPKGKGKGTGQTSGMTDPEVGKKTGNAGTGGKQEGSKGKSSKDKKVSEKEIKETKKVGKDPKKEEVGGAGVIGG